MNTISRYALLAMTVALVGFTPLGPVSSMNSQLRLSETLEQALPSLVSSKDYWSASKVSFQLASSRHRLKDTAAACGALSQSLDYYRLAIASDTQTPPYPFGAGLGEDEGMREIRSTFGCGPASV
jgi:hypothetical protein